MALLSPGLTALIVGLAESSSDGPERRGGLGAIHDLTPAQHAQIAEPVSEAAALE